MRKVRLAIVGFGNLGRKCAEFLLADPAMELAGILQNEGGRVSGEKAPVVDNISEIKGVEVALHVLPAGFHRIRHYGLLANAVRRTNPAKVRALLDAPQPDPLGDETDASPVPSFVCRCCGAAMRAVVNGAEPA